MVLVFGHLGDTKHVISPRTGPIVRDSLEVMRKVQRQLTSRMAVFDCNRSKTLIIPSTAFSSLGPSFLVETDEMSDDADEVVDEDEGAAGDVDGEGGGGGTDASVEGKDREMIDSRALDSCGAPADRSGVGGRDRARVMSWDSRDIASAVG